VKKIKKEFKLQGLHCANCALKIEKEVQNLTGVKNAKLNFASSTLSLEIQKDFNSEKIKEIVFSYEPDVLVFDGEDEVSEKNVSKKFLIPLIIGAVLFLSAFFIKNEMISNGLFLSAYLVTGHKVLLKSFRNILKGKIFDENFLMSIATIGAIAIGEFPEAVAVMLFYLVGEMLQERAVESSRKSIKKLMNLRIDYANIMVNGKLKKESAKKIKIGDIIFIKPGEKIPLDGVVIEGETRINKAAITGESYPQKAIIGTKVLSGSINEDSTIRVKVEKLFEESTASKIIKLVEEAASKKAKTEKFITKFASVYTPLVVLSALVLAVVPGLLFAQSYSEWIYRALLFLVISCPCALVVSIPLSYFAGIGNLSKNGILVKGGNYIDVLKKLDTIIFDKTGTLTSGVFKVVSVESFGNYSKEEVIRYAAYAEKQSSHPIAVSIIEKYGKTINDNEIMNFKNISGKGVFCEYDNKKIFVGNEKLFDEKEIKGIKLNNVSTQAIVSINGKIEGIIEISDEIKSSSYETIKRLKEMKIKTFILSGDNKNSTEDKAKLLGVKDFYYELLPENKVEKYEEISKNSDYTAFVGDGINDAPILTRADLGISMGGIGTDAAIESSDVVLMDDDPLKIVKGIKLSKYISKIIVQNLIFIFTIKVLFLSLGALGYATMWQAVFADVGVTVLSVLNSLRILKRK